MVLLTVKGTKNPDEFTFECSCKDAAGEVAPKITHIQNKRLSVRHQLQSFRELVPSAKVAVAMEGRPKQDASLAEELERLLDIITTDLKNARAAVLKDTYDSYWVRLRDLAVSIFPNECTHADDKDGSHDNAITALYQLYDNPEIDEEYRLMVYHCRCIMDPLWRIHEMIDPKNEGNVALWFNGKEIAKDSTIGSLCSSNEKSRIIVKVATSGGAAPSLEPRIGYDQQRELRQVFMTKAEERKQLEESELHAVIKRQYAVNPGVAIGAIAAAKVASANTTAPVLKGGKVTETVVAGN